MEQQESQERSSERNLTKNINNYNNCSTEASPNGRRSDLKPQQQLETQIITRKCLDHPTYPCDQLNLENHAKTHRICVSCVEQKNISKDKVISIKSLLDCPQQFSSSHNPQGQLDGRACIFNQLPILKDQGLISKLQAISNSIDVISKEIDAYFIELSKQIQISILKTQNIAKSKLNDIKKYYCNLMCTYEETACIQKFQEAVVASTNDEEKKLHELILQSYKQAEANAERIKGDLDAFMKQKDKFSLQQPKTMCANICGIIKSIDFFNKQTDIINNKEQIHLGNPQISIISFQEDEEEEDNEENRQMNRTPKESLIALSFQKNCQKSPQANIVESKEQQVQKQQQLQQKTQQQQPQHQDAAGKSQQLNDILISFSQASMIQYSTVPPSQQSQHTIAPSPSHRISLPIINIIPSKIYKQSFKKIKIESENNHSYLLTHIGKELNSQCFMDFPLEKAKKYIIQVEIIHNNVQQKNSGFIFGLIEDANKHSRDVSDSAMCYIECQDGGGIDKMIKGARLHSSSDSKSRRKFEFRVHLAEKYLRIASYPDYQTIAELDDSSKIKDDEEYYFAVSICFPEDQVRILDVFCIDKFDEKMR